MKDTTSKASDRQEEMFAHIETWQQIGTTQKHYCAEHQINTPVFQYWLRKYRKQHTTVDGFLPIQPVAIPGDTIRIHYPGGLEVHLPPQTSLHILKSLISLAR